MHLIKAALGSLAVDGVIKGSVYFCRTLRSRLKRRFLARKRDTSTLSWQAAAARMSEAALIAPSELPRWCCPCVQATVNDRCEILQPVTLRGQDVAVSLCSKAFSQMPRQAQLNIALQISNGTS